MSTKPQPRYVLECRLAPEQGEVEVLEPPEGYEDYRLHSMSSDPVGVLLCWERPEADRA